MIDAAWKIASSWLHLPNRRQYHPLNFQQPKETLSENKQEVEDNSRICFNHLQGLQDRDASSSTPTAWSDLKHEFVEEQSLCEKLPSVVAGAGGEILWQKKPRVRQVSSFSNQDETTMCSLIFRMTPIVNFVRRQKPREPGAE